MDQKLKWLTFSRQLICFLCSSPWIIKHQMRMIASPAGFDGLHRAVVDEVIIRIGLYAISAFYLRQVMEVDALFYL